MPRRVSLHDPALRAFSLVEILVVLAIIGLLAALLIPFLQSRLVEAAAAGSIGNLRTLALAMESYRGEFNGYGVPYSYTPAKPHPFAEGNSDWGIRLLRRYYKDGPPYIRDASGKHIPEPVESCPLRNMREGKTVSLAYAIAPGMDTKKPALVANSLSKIPMIWQDDVIWPSSRSPTSNPLKLVYRDRAIYAAFYDGSVRRIEATREDGRLFWGWWNEAVRNLNAQDTRLGTGSFIAEGQPLDQ